ncbi:hypothetical protein Y032_0023g690 [Ancylostoma ceylanicum]|nr:hypothetical protein Y032_0023g690 [Ancylostoma ceylanicum]
MAQEHINRRVLNEYIRIISLPNTDKKSPTELANFFINDVVLYKDETDPHPLTWATGTGSNGSTSSIRVKMTNNFWTYFTKSGRERMYEFNRKNKCEIRVIRDKTISLSDVDNLSLYLRKKIRDYIATNGLPSTELVVKQGYITIGGTKKYRSTELAIRLGLDYSDWKGTAILELLTNTEKKSLEDHSVSSPRTHTISSKPESRKDWEETAAYYVIVK